MRSLLPGLALIRVASDEAARGRGRGYPHSPAQTFLKSRLIAGILKEAALAVCVSESTTRELRSAPVYQFRESKEVVNVISCLFNP